MEEFYSQTLNISAEFLHRDELTQQYGAENISLPVALIKNKDNHLQVWISADETNQCQSLNDLKALVLEKLR